MRVLAQIRAVPENKAVPGRVVPAKALVGQAPADLAFQAVRVKAVPAKARVGQVPAVQAVPGRVVPVKARVGQVPADPAVPGRVVPVKADPERELADPDRGQVVQAREPAVPAKVLVDQDRGLAVPVKAVPVPGLEARRRHHHPQLVGPEQEDPAQSEDLATRLDLLLALDQRLDPAWPGLDAWRDLVRVGRVRVVDLVKAVDQIKVDQAKPLAAQGRPPLKPEQQEAVDQAKPLAAQGRPPLKPELQEALVVPGRVGRALEALAIPVAPGRDRAPEALATPVDQGWADRAPVAAPPEALDQEVLDQEALE